MDKTGGAADNRLAIASIASAAGGVLHATAAGIHAEHAELSRVFVVLAVAQMGAAVVGFVRPGRSAAALLGAVNAVALTGWIATRATGISWIEGLERAERAQPADTIAALFAAVALVMATIAFTTRRVAVSGRAVAAVAVAAGVLVVPGLSNATSHDHASHELSSAEVGDGQAHDHAGDEVTAAGVAQGAASAAIADGDGHDHDDSSAPTPDSAGSTSTDAGSAPTWPRPWDPMAPIDFSGVSGATAAQQARAEQLVRDTLRDLPAFADVSTIGALGYRSIGDAASGFEHFVNYELLMDDKSLDPTAPESLVFRVDGEQRTLVSAMFIVTNTPIDDPELVDFGGPLMQWHVHDNLCWGLDENGQPKVKAVLTSPGDTCPPGTINTGGDNPMVHVWITPHECGPFAALEGHGAGQADAGDGTRVDQCAHDHDSSAHSDVKTQPYDPSLPIDLGGVPGVTPEQQAFAENLVAATVRDLPQWSDLAVVEAAGFHSIGDAITGHEHYIQWEWIDDDVWLDPDRPESLVFEPQPDGSKKLVSAMFMLPSGHSLDDVPDWGGSLMQWHVHGDLCFTDDPVAPQVAGLKPTGGTCQPPLVDFLLSPMIHVWITPTPCGPFAALEGIGGGQVPEGEQVLCDHAHGSP
ncbi:MAG TPA: hypothetical protein VE487_00835 [Ilumatobacter sp.]|nr:hypothetical protein [Ilumatobacter sp.]